MLPIDDWFAYVMMIRWLFLLWFRLSFHMSHLAHPPKPTTAGEEPCLVSITELVANATKTNAAAMASEPSPSRANASLTSVQWVLFNVLFRHMSSWIGASEQCRDLCFCRELDESVNMENLWALADDGSGIEDNLQLANINVCPLSPPAEDSFYDGALPIRGNHRADSSLFVNVTQWVLKRIQFFV